MPTPRPVRSWTTALILFGLVAVSLALVASQLPVGAPSSRAAGPPAASPPGSPQGAGADDRAGAAAPGKAPGPRLRLLVPAYFYPSGPDLDQWERLIDGAARAP